MLSKNRVTIISLFPDFFTSSLQASVLGRALKNNVLQINIINLRDFAINKHGQVDDSPYGGGPGMVLMVEPIKNALASIETNKHVVLLSPRGYQLKQAKVKQLSKLTSEKELIILCGHYEGVDERIIHYIDESISIGSYVLSGGEPAALVLIDAIARQLPGFVKKKQSIEEESYSIANNIEYEQYSRPSVFDNHAVPQVLLSGDHKKIALWREQQSKLATKKYTET